MEYLMCWTKEVVEWVKVKNLQCEVPQIRRYGVVTNEYIDTQCVMTGNGWKLVYDKATDNDTALAFLLNEEGCHKIYTGEATDGTG